MEATREKKDIINSLTPKFLALAFSLITMMIYFIIAGELLKEFAFSHFEPIVLLAILIALSLLGMVITDIMAKKNKEYNSRELIITIYSDVISVLGLILVLISCYFAYFYESQYIGDSLVTNRSIFLSILAYRYFSRPVKRLYYFLNNKFSKNHLSLIKDVKADRISLYFVGLIILILSYIPTVLFGVDVINMNDVPISIEAIESVVLPAVLINLAVDQFYELIRQ